MLILNLEKIDVLGKFWKLKRSIQHTAVHEASHTYTHVVCIYGVAKETTVLTVTTTTIIPTASIFHRDRTVRGKR